MSERLAEVFEHIQFKVTISSQHDSSDYDDPIQMFPRILFLSSWDMVKLLKHDMLMIRALTADIIF